MHTQPADFTWWHNKSLFYKLQYRVKQKGDQCVEIPLCSFYIRQLWWCWRQRVLYSTTEMLEFMDVFSCQKLSSLIVGQSLLDPILIAVDKTNKPKTNLGLPVIYGREIKMPYACFWQNFLRMIKNKDCEMYLEGNDLWMTKKSQ